MGDAVLCPRCKIPMSYVSETEKMGDEKRITRYYLCPVCGTKVIDEKLTVRMDTDKLIVIYVNYAGNGKRPVITPRVAPARRAPRRVPARAR